MEDKENLCNVKVDEGCVAQKSSSNDNNDGSGELAAPITLLPPPKVSSKTNDDSSQSSNNNTLTLSPTYSDLYMVSPPPPPPANNNCSITVKTPAIKSPIPPPNSQHIQSAFKEFEKTLDNEVDNVDEMYNVKGTATKNQRGRGALNNNDWEDGITSPESDCVNSPVPPVFPPYRSPMRKKSLSLSPKRSFIKSPIGRSSIDSSSSSLGKAFRNAESTINAEMNDFNLIATTGQGTATKKYQRGRSLLEYDYGTSPDSDCFNSPIPPVFPPSYHSPMKSRSLSPMRRSPTRSRHLTPNARSSMNYSSLLGKTPTTTGAAAASPLINKSLFRMSQLLEENHRADEGDDDDSFNSADDDGGDELSKSNDGSIEFDATNNDTFNEGGSKGDINLSTLNLNDDESSDDGSVKISKPSKRRIIDDDSDSDDESSAVGDKSDVSEEESSDAHEFNEQAESQEDILSGKGFSGLTLDDDDDESILSQEEEDPDFHGGGDAFTSFGGSISGDDNNDAVSVSSSESNNNSKDNSFIMFDGCGCWELDKDNEGDLYLSDNSDVKWPKIRLPLTLYNKLFQHQRIGVQWMASLHKNEIKGGILADDMGMVSDIMLDECVYFADSSSNVMFTICTYFVCLGQDHANIGISGVINESSDYIKCRYCMS